MFFSKQSGVALRKETVQLYLVTGTVGVSGAPPAQHTIMGALTMICENAKEVHRVAWMTAAHSNRHCVPLHLS